MENQKHTAEPWELEFDGFNHKIVWSETIIAHTWKFNINDAANARRIVACVNACAGILTEELEQMEAGEVSETMQKIAQMDAVWTAQHAVEARLRAENERLKNQIWTLRDILNSALTHQVANRDTIDAFYRTYTYPGHKMPDWVYRAEAALSETAQPAGQ